MWYGACDDRVLQAYFRARHNRVLQACYRASHDRVLQVCVFLALRKLSRKASSLIHHPTSPFPSVPGAWCKPRTAGQIFVLDAPMTSEAGGRAPAPTTAMPVLLEVGSGKTVLFLVRGLALLVRGLALLVRGLMLRPLSCVSMHPNRSWSIHS